MALSGAHTLSVIGDVIPLQTDFIYDAWDLLRRLAFLLSCRPGVVPIQHYLHVPILHSILTYFIVSPRLIVHVVIVATNLIH